MITQSYKDIRRYLSVSGKLNQATPDYFTIKGSDTAIIPHNGSSLFGDVIPVGADLLEKINEGKVLYGVSHNDGEIYLAMFTRLKKYIGSEKTDNNYLVPKHEFVNIKDFIKLKDRPIIHIHVHSEFSMSDGMTKADDLARRCKQLNMPAVGLTDHGNMSGHIEFYKGCKRYGIKPIIGQEFYFDDDVSKKGAPDEIKKGFKKDKEMIKKYEREHRLNQRRHLILIAKDNEGLSNLYKLSSEAFLKGFYYRPRIDWKLLEKYHKGIMASTACLGGIIWGEKDTKARIENLKRLVKIFGKDDLYFETFLNELPEQRQMNDYMFDLSDKTGIKVYCGTDLHYLDPDPHGVHQKYMKIGSGFSFGEGENYLKTYDEMKATYEKYFDECKHTWDKYEQCFNTAEEMADKCHIDIELGKFKIPAFNIKTAAVPALPDENNLSYIKRRAIEGFKARVIPSVDKDKLKEYTARLKYEIKIFVDAGYIDYTLIVLDMIDYAKSLGWVITVRGSAAGSLFCYCLGMTNVDPIKCDLMFERFVSPLRAGLVDKSYQSPPDIDADYPDRSLIISYAIKKYGADNVARISTCNRFQIKRAIKDMASATAFADYQEINKLTRIIPDGVNTIDEALESKEFKEWYETDKNKTWFDNYIEPIINLASGYSIHASGIVIAPGRVVDYTPVKFQEKKNETEGEQDTERLVVTQLDGDSLEAIGLLKFDILRVRTLGHLHTTRELIKDRHNKNIDFTKINIWNSKHYSGFNKKDTQGVFQLDTKSTSNLLNSMTVNSFTDLMALISLSRPGTAGPGLDMEYCERKKGKPFEYDHPLLESVLKDSYGIMIYQELLMKTLNIMAGFSLVEADKFRKIIKKKDLQQLASYREKFIAGSMERGFKTRGEAMTMWEKITSWGKYGFCRSHAAAYAQVSLWTMLIKQLYPLEFYVGWLENPKDKAQVVNIYKDIRKHEIPIIFPNVNESKSNFQINKNNEIVWALKGIKYVGEGITRSIAEHAPYTGFNDFVTKNKNSKLTKRAVDPLICINAFPWCKTPREAAEGYYKFRRMPIPPEFAVDDRKYWNKMFYRYMGFYREDPTEIYKAELKPYGNLDTISDYHDLPLGDGVKIAGYITEVREINSRRGLMAILKLEVDMEEITIIAWSSFYGKSEISKSPLSELIGKFVFVFGSKDCNDRSEEQIQLGDINEDVFKVLE